MPKQKQDMEEEEARRNKHLDELLAVGFLIVRSKLGCPLGMCRPSFLMDVA